MPIERAELKALDPLRLLSHQVIFQNPEEEGEGQEEEKEEDERLLRIWKSFYPTFKQREAPLRPIKLKRHLLKELAKWLNSDDLQQTMKSSFFEQKRKMVPSISQEAEILKVNLERINGKIDKANQVWYRRLPLISRIFHLIERINIPVD